MDSPSGADIAVSLHGRHTQSAGDWIVIDGGRWGHDYRACRVIKVTDAKVVATHQSRSAARHFYKDDVLFTGPENAATRVAEQLQSSAARQKQAERQAAEQHGERMAKIIAAAEQALANPEARS